MLIALWMLAEVVGEGLGRVTGERLDGEADDGQFTRGNGHIGAHPGLQLPVRRIELRPRGSGLLEGFGLVGGRQTRGAGELFGRLGQRQRLGPVTS